MRNRITIISILLISTAALGILRALYSSIFFTRLFYFFLALLATYIVFKIILQKIVMTQIHDDRTRYALRRMTSILLLLSFIAIAIAIWVENLGAVLLSYGILAAVAAFALQDFLKNFAGSLSIIFSGIYRIGDRIEINSKKGDVINIGLLYTTLLETNEWVNGDQATGRLSILPNSLVLTGIVNNYTKDHPYIWEDLALPITYDSNWKEAVQIIEKIVGEETRDYSEKSQTSLSKLTEKYYFTPRTTEPAIFVTLTDNWIALNIRYITEVRQRRILNNRISRRILTEFESRTDIKIASETLTITLKQ